MKNQKLSRVARQCAMLCVCLLALTAAAVVNAQGKTKGKVVKAGDLGIASKSNAEGSTAQAEVDPKIVKGLEAAAAAAKHTGKNLVFPSSTRTSFVLIVVVMFEENEKVTREDVGRGVDIGVIYVGAGNKELPTGYYYVKLSEQVEAGKDAATAKPMYAVTLSDVEPGSAGKKPAGSGNATGRRQYRPILIRKDIDKTTPLMINTATFAGDIMAAVEQSIVNTTKSNVKEH